MRRGSRWIAAAGLAVAMAGGIAAAATDGDTEQELTGSTLDEAFEVVAQEPDDDTPGADRSR